MASSGDGRSEEKLELEQVRIRAVENLELSNRLLKKVLQERQKLLNLKVGDKCARDSSLLSSVTLKRGFKTLMESTTEEEIFVEKKICVDPVVKPPEILPASELGDEYVAAIKDTDVNKDALRSCVDNFELTFLNPPRPGKKLLVLDIDATLCYCYRSIAEDRKAQIMRPYLHEFLSQSYSAYDIIIWSAVNMEWAEVKMKNLGVLSNPNYKITALMDRFAMITVQSPTNLKEFYCKPLDVIWAKCPEFYNPSNTIMFDDLKRNFVMNPQNGLVIEAFGHWNRATDNELVSLTDYLLAIAERGSLSGLDHRRWHDYAGARAVKEEVGIGVQNLR